MCKKGFVLSKKNVKKERENKRIKIEFYIMSLWLLFALLVLLTIDIPISFQDNAKFIGFVQLLQKNILSIIFLCLTIISWGLTKVMKYRWRGVCNPPYKITSVKNENFEYLTFLTTYIIPLICLDLNNIRYIIVLGILLVLIGSIFVKMDLYYGNPTLTLLGYRLYRAEIQGIDAPNGIILISKDRLSTNKSIEWIKIGEFVWVVKENIK